MAKDMGAEVAFSSILPLKGNEERGEKLEEEWIDTANQQLAAKLEMTTGIWLL